MLTPDEQLALDILHALDSRCTPTLDPALTRQNKLERCRLEQCCQMTRALSGWLERWMDDPHHGGLRAKDDPLWQAVAVVHDHLELSQRCLEQAAVEVEEAASRRRRRTGGAGTRGEEARVSFSGLRW